MIARSYADRIGANYLTNLLFCQVIFPDSLLISRGLSMAEPDLDLLQTAMKRRWSRGPSQKAKPSVHAFAAAERRGTKITAKVVGNHGTYTVSIQGDPQGVTSAR